MNETHRLQQMYTILSHEPRLSPGKWPLATHTYVTWPRPET